MDKKAETADVSIGVDIVGLGEPAIREAILKALEAVVKKGPAVPAQAYLAIDIDSVGHPEIGDPGVLEVTKGPEVLTTDMAEKVARNIKIPEVIDADPTTVYALLRAA